MKKEQQQQREREDITNALSIRLEEIDNSRRDVQERLHKACDALRRKIDEMEERINRELEVEFKYVDERYQKTLSEMSTINTENDDEFQSLMRKAKAELLVKKSFVLEESTTEIKEKDLSHLYKLGIKKEVFLEWVYSKKPDVLEFRKFSEGRVHLRVKYLNSGEERALSENGLKDSVKYTASLKKKKKDIDNNNITGEYAMVDHGEGNFSFSPGCLEPAVTYLVQVKAVLESGESEWSDSVEFVSLEFNECAWKECPDNINENKKYLIDENSHKIATNIDDDVWDSYCTIIGDVPLPLNRVTSWSIKILQSNSNDGYHIYIGVAPFDINQNEEYNDEKCGWYFYCYESALYSGPPHNHRNKKYGPRKESGKYVHTGDSVGVVMDTAKRGELSFILNGVNYGIAYKGIPLDKPLVPCVLLYCYMDSVELVI